MITVSYTKCLTYPFVLCYSNNRKEQQTSLMIDRDTKPSRTFAGAATLAKTFECAESTVRKNWCYGVWPFYKIGRKTVSDLDEIIAIVETTRHEIAAK